MSRTYQQTVSELISFSGIGLHTGRNAKITIHPAAAGTGFIFKRIDPKGLGTEIVASWQHTKELPLCTCIANENGVQVRTIEHLMAAFYACEIDNALIEIDGSEIPILDGSALPFVTKLDQINIIQQDLPLRTIQILKPIEARDGERFIKIEPANNLTIDLTISLAKIGKLNWSGPADPSTIKQQIIPARTFGRLKNGIMAKIGTRFMRDPICLGANTKTALVIVGDKVINKGGLRMPDEFIRHRILDAMGDMMLAGAHIKGKITGNSTAHRLNHMLLHTLFSDDKAWHWESND